MEQRDPHGTADSERETDGAKEHARNADSLIHAEIARLAVNDPGRSAVHWWLVLGYADRTSAEN